MVYMRMTELAEQLKDEDYLYWIKSALCLQYTKEGLIQFAIKKSEDLYTNVLQRCGNPSPGGLCSSVHINYRNGVIKCCGRCERYVNELKILSTGNLNLMNSNISALPLHPWQMAKLLMNVGQDVSNIDARQTDLAGILNFIDHYTLARADIKVVSRIRKVQNIRNRIMHPAEMKVTANDFSNNIIPALTGLLEERKVLENNLCAKEAVEKINEVAATSFHITNGSEVQVLKTLITDLHLELITIDSNLNTNLRNLEERQRSELETELKKVAAALRTLNEKVHSDAELRAKLYTDLQKTEQYRLQLMMGLENCRQEIKEVSAKLNRLWSEDDAVVEYPTACSKCKSSIKIPAQEECENRDTLLTGCVNSENLSELWVCCIKLYPWIKAELGMKLTICIASDLLGQDNVDSMKDKKRCMAANELLYHVLKDRSLLLVSFLELLEFHCEPSDAFKKKLEDVWPTNKEMKGYACLNGDLFETSLYKNDVVDTDQNQRSITERPNRLQPIQRRRIQSFIQDIETINALIDNLLSNCYFSLLDHEDVHNLLALDNKPVAAECLTEKMANGSEDMIRECCKILNSRRQGHVSRIFTSPDGNPHETDEPIVVERHLYPHIINRLAQIGEYLVRSLRMKINNVVFRSIVFHLQPIAEKSWKLLADKCSEGQFTEILGLIFPSENVLRFFSNKKNRLRVTIFSMPHHKSNIEDDEMAVLKLELTTTDSICTQDAKTLETNPIKRNINLFCEELEINHDLLSSLKTNCVVQDDIEEKLKHIYSREAAIRCLMESISQPETGYSVLKGYSKEFHPYLYQELEKTEKDEDVRKLLFQCEAWTIPKNKETLLTTGTTDQYDWVTENIKCCFNKDDTHKMVATISKTADEEIQSTTDTGERDPLRSTETADEEMQTIPDTAERKSLVFGVAMKLDKDDKSIYMRMTALAERLKDEEYRHWIKASICLQYTKEGLEQFAIKKSQNLHNNVLLRCGNPSPKGICSSVQINHSQGVIKCCGHCERYLDALSQLSTGKLNLRNSEITDLPLQHWQMAKLLMNEGQDALSTDAGKADIAGILNFIDHYILAKADIQDVKRIQEVRNTRNKIMHSAKMKVTSDDFTNKIIPALIGLLEEEKVVENNITAKEAVDKIKEVAASDFHITKESEFQALENVITDVITNVRYLESKLNDMAAHQSRDFQAEIKRVDEVLQTLKQKVNSEAELRARDNQETKDNFEQLSSDLAKCRSEIEDMSAKVDFMFLEDKTKYPEVCSKCGSGIKVEDQEGCENQDPMLRDIGCVNSENLSELWVCCIKLYPWIKAELGKKLTICIASELLGQDNVDSMKTSQRCIAADGLLKHVLKDRSLLLVSFLKHLEFHCEPSNALRKKLEAVRPTKKEMTEYARLNDYLIVSSQHKNYVLDTDQNQRQSSLHEDQKRTLQFYIQDTETVNALIDNLLSNCYFSLLDHEDVHNLLVKGDLPEAARCLIEKMAKGTDGMIHECCEILNSRGKRHVSRVLSPDEKTNETAKQITVEKDLYPYIIDRLDYAKAILLRSFLMTIEKVFFRPIVFHLQPIAEDSLKLMADKCSAGQFTEILRVIFPSENVLRFFSNNKNRLRVTISSTPHHKSDNKGNEMAVLKLELTTTGSFRTQDAKTLETNPTKCNIDLFCEELEINHDLLSSLKANCVVQDNIEEKLMHIYSREAAIRCLMETISKPEIGYSVLKGHSKEFYPYLYQELEKTEKDENARKLLFQCEAWTVPKNKETKGNHDQYDWVTENLTCYDKHKMVQTISKTADREIQRAHHTARGMRLGMLRPFPHWYTVPRYSYLTTKLEHSRLEGVIKKIRQRSKSHIESSNETKSILSDLSEDVEGLLDDLNSELQRMNTTITELMHESDDFEMRTRRAKSRSDAERSRWKLEGIKQTRDQLYERVLSDYLDKIINLHRILENLKLLLQQIEKQLKTTFTEPISGNRSLEVWHTITRELLTNLNAFRSEAEKTGLITERLKRTVEQLYETTLVSVEYLDEIKTLIRYVEGLNAEVQQIATRLKTIITEPMNGNQRLKIRLASFQTVFAAVTAVLLVCLCLAVCPITSFTVARHSSLLTALSECRLEAERTNLIQEELTRNVEKLYKTNLVSSDYLNVIKNRIRMLKGLNTELEQGKMQMKTTIGELTSENRRLEMWIRVAMQTASRSEGEKSTLMLKQRKEKIAEDFQELYTHEYTNAVLEMETTDISAGLEKDIKLFLEILKLSDDLCRNYSTSHLISIRESIANLRIDLPFDRDDQKQLQKAVNLTIDDKLSTIDLSKIFEVKQIAALRLLEPVTKIITDVIVTRFDVDQRKNPKLFSYIEKCVHFCWMMNMHSDPVHIKFVQISDQTEFDTDMFETFRRAGKHIAYIVWPPLYSSDGGEILVKGKAEGKD